MRRLMFLAMLVSVVRVASGQIVITEWMYNGSGTGSTGEFVEFTNVGAESVDMTGWSFDDDSRIAGTISLSAFGVVLAGQSVILTDEPAEDFATIWSLSGVKIIGGSTANLGRNDEINLYDAGSNLVDRLSYGDETYPGTVRTQYRSCNIPATGYSYTQVQAGWVLASEGDSFGSKVSTRGEVASPGRIVNCSKYDLDCDSDVDVVDVNAFRPCLAGSGVFYDPLPSGCSMTPDAEGYIGADLDRDEDVDQDDFGMLQRCYSGPGVPLDPSCLESSGGSGTAEIILNGNSITVTGDGVTVDGTKATVIAAGTYHVTGALADGQLAVNANTEGVVELILDGVNISNSTTAPICILSADEASIVLAAGSANYLSDPTTYVFENPEEDEPNAALFSYDRLTISGSGSLTVTGNYNDAIASKDELIITGGTITANAVDDGIRGKDYLFVTGGTITVVAGGDGLKSDNEEDTALGFISIGGGSLNITSGGDAITAQTSATVTAGSLVLKSGGGSNVTIPDTLSAKGIKAPVSVVIEGGTFSINAADDAVHSNDSMTINGGTFSIATADDGFHADNTLVITDGTINITKSYEGIESKALTINGGEIHTVSSDDGINGAGGVDGSGTWPPGPGQPPAGSGSLAINGGYIAVIAAGDGIDVNGNIVMTGGTVIVHGPTSDNNGAMDYDGSFNISGGFLVAAGSGGMVQTPSTSSTQRSVHLRYQSSRPAGTLLNIQRSGTSLLTFAPSKAYRSVVFSAPTLVSGSGYSVYRQGSCSGTLKDGLYTGGTYTPGTLSTTFTISNIVTTVNNLP